jgi:hypothetical protein
MVSKRTNMRRLLHSTLALVVGLITTAVIQSSPSQAQVADLPLTGTITLSSAGPSPASNGIYVSWNDTIQNERGFLVYRYNGSTTELVTNCSVSTPNLNFCLDPSLTSDTIYLYYIYAWNNTGTIYAGSYVAARTGGGSASLSPLVESATATGLHSALIGWNDLSDDETAYRVYRYVGGSYQLEGTFPADTTTATITNPAMDMTTFQVYTVASVNALGVAFGDSYVYSLPFVPPVGNPVSPSNVTAYFDLVGDQGYVGLNWQDNSTNEDGFVVYQYDGANFTRVCVTNSLTTNCSFPQTYQPGKFLYYYVYSYRGSTVGTPASAVLHLTERLDPPTMGAATGASSSSVFLTWSPGLAATGYKILEYVNGSFVTVATLTANVGEFTVTGLSPSTTHVYVLKSTNGTRISNQSAAIYATTRS